MRKFSIIGTLKTRFYPEYLTATIIHVAWRRVSIDQCWMFYSTWFRCNDGTRTSILYECCLYFIETYKSINRNHHLVYKTIYLPLFSCQVYENYHNSNTKQCFPDIRTFYQSNNFQIIPHCSNNLKISKVSIIFDRETREYDSMANVQFTVSLSR